MGRGRSDRLEGLWTIYWKTPAGVFFLITPQFPQPANIVFSQTFSNAGLSKQDGEHLQEL